MPFDFELDQPRRIVLSRAWGELTDDDLLSHLQRVTEAFEEGMLDSTWGQIADFSNVMDAKRVSSDAIRQMAERNPWPRQSPRVLIVRSDLHYGLGRMYQLIGEERTERMILVRSYDEAIEYIKHAGGSNTKAS